MLDSFFPGIYVPFQKIIEKAEENLAEWPGKSLGNDIFVNALSKLDAKDRAMIDKLAKILVRIVKASEGYTLFNYDDALEILAKLGIFIINKVG